MSFSQINSSITKPQKFFPPYGYLDNNLEGGSIPYRVKLSSILTYILHQIIVKKKKLG